MSCMQLDRKLKLISAIGAGQTINIFDGTITLHDTYWTAAKRWWLGESRTQTVEWIKYSILEALTKLYREPRGEELYYLIKNSAIGITHLMGTYRGDAEAVAILDECLYTMHFTLQDYEHYFIETHGDSMILPRPSQNIDCPDNHSPKRHPLRNNSLGEAKYSSQSPGARPFRIESVKVSTPTGTTIRNCTGTYHVVESNPNSFNDSSDEEFTILGR